MNDLIEHRKAWAHCERCPLGGRAFRHCVVDISPRESPAAKTTKVDVLFVGEGPGRSEDAIGRPFVGVSGRLLRETVALSGGENYVVAYSNLLACRPQDAPGGEDRSPQREEVEACAPRLEELVRILRPRTVVAVGKVPKQYLWEASWNCEAIEDTVSEFINHPSFILRTGGRKSPYYVEWKQEVERIFGKIHGMR